MANPVAGQAFLRIQDGLGDQRFWQAVFAATPQPAGTSLTVTCTSGTAGASPPGVEDTLSLEVLGDTGSGVTVLRTIALTAGSASQTTTFTLTDTAAAGGSNRCGTYQVRIHAVKTTGGGLATYDVRSDGTGTPPSGDSIGAFNNGYVLSQTSLTVGLEPSAGGAKPALFAYGDAFWARVTLGAPPVVAGPTITVTLNGLTTTATMIAGTGTYDVQWTGIVDNRFAASSSSYATTTSLSSASGAGIGAWLSPSSTMQDSDLFDPRLTFTHLLQVNDNTFGTPPSSKNVTSGQRLTSDLGFLSARVTNANGVGLNSISWTTTLQDHGHLTSAQTATPTSMTQGGQAGWGNAFLAWSNTLPGGQWDKSSSITAPSTATGLEQSATTTYTLIAANPNLRIICGGGPASLGDDVKHWSPGMPFEVGLVVFNTQTLTTVALDASPVPSVFLGRFNYATGKVEYLDSDGITWLPATGATVYAHTLTVSPADANAWLKQFTASQTAGWGTADVFVIGRCFVGGVPVNDFSKEIVVGTANPHTGYSIDALQLALTGGLLGTH